MEQIATRKELRQFGLLVGGILAVIGVWPFIARGEALRIWAIGPGALLILAGAVVPQVLAPIHKGWMWVGHVLGTINTKILLGVVFYGLITPIGFVFRLLGKNTMRQGFAEDCSTYRVVRQPRPHTHMKYQF